MAMPGFDTLASWCALAAAGALHGLHPASGWPLLLACGLQGRGRIRRVLPAMALGHLAAMLLAAGGVLLPLSRGWLPRGLTLWWPWLVLALLLAQLAWRFCGAARVRVAVPHPFALAWGCGGLGMLQGAGLTLVPVLGGMCGDGMAWSGALLPALGALGLHLAAMLAAMLLAGSLAARTVAAASALGQSMRRTSPFQGEAFSWNRSCRYCTSSSSAMKSGTTKSAGLRLPSLPTA